MSLRRRVPHTSPRCNEERRTQYVGPLEILAAVCVYYSLGEVLRGCKVLHHIDNTSALASLVKGYSGVSDLSQIVHALWALALASSVDVWFEHVKSAANIADWPSRGMILELARDFRAQPIEPDFPPLSSRLDICRCRATGLDFSAKAPPVHKRRRRH
jgi:hypothetical protein